MLDNMTRWLGGVSDVRLRMHLRGILESLVDRYATQALSSAGLAIKSGGSAVVKTGASDQHLIANGVPLKITAATDMAALSGTVTNAKFNVYCFFIDAAGNKTSLMGTEGATRAAMKFPAFPKNKALIGYIVINPTGTGNFTGGTTALDDGTVTPNAEYVNPLGPFDPSVLIG